MFTISDCRAQGSNELLVEAHRVAKLKLSLYRQAIRTIRNSNSSYSPVLEETLVKYTMHHREFLARKELHKLEVLVAAHDITRTVQLLTRSDITEFLVSCALFQLSSEHINRDLDKVGNSIIARQKPLGKSLFDGVVTEQQTSHYVQYFTPTDNLIWLRNDMVSICGVDILVDQEQLCVKECYDQMLQLLAGNQYSITVNGTGLSKQEILRVIKEYPHAKL